MNLYHYCSNPAFISIISTREIWASELSLSNDRLEGKWIRHLFSEYCREKNISQRDETTLLTHMDDIVALTGGAGFCMSAEGDLLSQWRGYAENGTGVAIGFAQEYFETLQNVRRDRNNNFNASLTKVEYDPIEQKARIAKIADPIFDLVADGALLYPSLLSVETDQQKTTREQSFRKLRFHFLLFIFELYSLKNPAFSEEREWRVISHIVSRDNERLGLRAMDFRGLDDRIIPFRRIPLENLQMPAIREVVLGPKNITPKPVMEAALAKWGWDAVAVRQSSASYR